VAVVAVVCGIAWNRLVSLPSYVIGEDFRARMPEASLGKIAATDVYFALIGCVGGLAVGVIAWVVFRRLGWFVTLIAALGALLGGAIMRTVGEFIGPRNFETRIAGATLGDEVRIDFQAHTWVPLAVWVAMAVVPILIGTLAQGRKLRQTLELPRETD
jgi:hypothetical protein